MQGGDEVGHELDGHDDLDPDRRPDDVLRLGGLDFPLGERHDLAERQREIEWRMRDRAEIRIGPRGLIVRRIRGTARPTD